MPIYEYQCQKCRRAFSFLVRNSAHHSSPSCPQCRHAKMTRVLSRFSAPVSSKSQAFGSDALDGPAGDDMPPGMDLLMAEAQGIDEKDPRAMGRFMRKMAAETGEAMPAEMHEFVRRLESGEDPEQIEADMGDVMGEAPGASPGGTGDTLYDG